ncbi:MAG: transglutaminase-like domain-containing protein [Smithellaceae bacterium]
MSKIRWFYVWGVFVTISFLTLLAIHLESFRKNQQPVPIVQSITAQRPADTWMNIYQKGKKIGVVHRTFTSRDKGFHFTENVFMQINTMGVIQPLNISIEGDLNPDMTFSSFDFNLTSSLFRFSAHGYIAENKLLLFTGLPNARQKSEILLNEIPHMSGSIYDAAFRANLEKDMMRNFTIFDPSTLALRSIKVTRNADEIIAVAGKRILAQKYCADFMGARNCAWLGYDGETLKENSILGLSMEKVSPEKAQEEISKNGSIDFTQIASIPANVKIDKAEKLNQLKIKISGIGDLLLHLNGDRQSFRKDVLIITRERLTAQQSSVNNLSQDVAVFLKESPLVQANHPQMKAQVDKIVNSYDLPEQKIRKIVNWVYRNVEKKPVLSVPNALEVLKNKIGDCNEHAVLVAALLRTAGIPAQIETGLVYLAGRFYYHAWNIAYMEKWITADAVFNQFPADVTHIRLVRGEGSEQLNLMGVIGKIKLEILTTP